MPNDTTSDRACSKCDVVKPATEYYPSRPGQLRRECKPCHLAKVRDYRVKNRAVVYKLYYGLTEERYAELFQAQGGVCAICRKPESEFSAHGGTVSPLQIDHDHRCCPGRKRCGECIRGLLCGRCNRALGLFKDDPDLIAAAARYLSGAVSA